MMRIVDALRLLGDAYVKNKNLPGALAQFKPRGETRPEERRRGGIVRQGPAGGRFDGCRDPRADACEGVSAGRRLDL